jgi:MtN3 and saliva related transmembrane protein
MMSSGLSSFTSLLGGLAMVLSVASFAPQAFKIIQSRDTSALSTGMYVLTVTGFVAWFGYGFLNGDWPIMISNAICGAFAAFILTMKLLPKTAKDEVADTLTPKS